jgi:hypothetical protein
MPQSSGLYVAPYGLCYAGIVTSIPSATSFSCIGLAGLPNRFFEEWYLFVAARVNLFPPNTERKLITSYTPLWQGTSGLFAYDAAFLTPLAVGDTVYLIHPSIAGTSVSLDAIQTSLDGADLPMMVETWQFMEPDVWNFIQPATGFNWTNADKLYAVPNANENCRIRTRDVWASSSGYMGANRPYKKFYVEFEVRLQDIPFAVPELWANIDPTTTFLGLTSSPGDTRASNNIKGFCFDGGVLNCLTDMGGVEILTPLSLDLSAGTPVFLLKIEVIAGSVLFYVDGVLVATHANLSYLVQRVNLYLATNAGGPEGIYVGPVSMGYKAV